VSARKMLVIIKYFFFGLLLQFGMSQELFEVRLPCDFETFAVEDMESYSCVVRNFTGRFSNPFYYIIVEGRHQQGRTNEDVLNIVFENSTINRLPSSVFQIFTNIRGVQANDVGIDLVTNSYFFWAPRIEIVIISNNVTFNFMT
jgi:hypothetical protein